MTSMLNLPLALLCALPLFDREAVSLDGTWEVCVGQAEAGSDWIPIRVPASFEIVLGTDFDGLATYRREFAVPAGFFDSRVVLEFEGAATLAQVFVDGQEVGQHLGAWTPFRFDITSLVEPGATHDLTVVLDEKVGHNTQGFLPIIAPHFGGLWQSVRLLALPHESLDDLNLLAVGDFERRLALFEADLPESSRSSVRVKFTVEGRTTWVTMGKGRREVAVRDFQAWEIGAPKGYAVLFQLVSEEGEILDEVERRLCFRSIRAEGRQLIFNGRPLNVRGMLEWGYFPPSLDPAPSDEVMHKVISDAQARGFNLIKFCLWIPPQRILRMCDEAGLLVWMEYPTWHPRFDGEHRSELTAEFEEFYALDRNHPSVILRSLTCETGPSASLEVIQDLYDRAKANIPGAVVVDDSSWIQWNRVFDFYDDHPYGNNNTWPAKLDELNEFITTRTLKPLVLGEAIAADTWPGSDLGPGVSLHADAVTDWASAVRERYGPSVVESLRPNSLRFAENQRKDQIEAFRRQVPGGGYVVSVARDFNKAEMGLADHRGEHKWSIQDWAWHGETMIVPGRDSARAIESGEVLSLPLHAAHNGTGDLSPGSLQATWNGAPLSLEHPRIEPGAVQFLGELKLRAPRVDAPRELKLEVRLGSADASNDWSLWALPPTQPLPDGVRVVRSLDPGQIVRMLMGEKVILLTDGRAGSVKVSDTWLLRGSLWFPTHPLTKTIAPEFFLDLVVKDLHPSGLMRLEELGDQIQPVLAFWETHDLDHVRDSCLVFETRVGAGRLLVSSLNHDNAAGRYLLSAFAQHLTHGPVPKAALEAHVVDAISERLEGRSMDLTSRSWLFRPDPDENVEEDPDWVEIPIGRAWESFGFETLDGWATYALDLDLSGAWLGQPLYVNFEGVDDAFKVHFDGTLCGTGGDIPNRATAFDEASSHRLTEALSAGAHRLEVRVYDWYGAGGIHRPVHLSNVPLAGGAGFIALR